MSLSEKYKKEVAPALAKEFGIKNVMAIPRITKIVVNTGTGEALKNKELSGKIADDLAQITGQKAKITKAKLSIAGFNIRSGMNVGMVVTLRGVRMYDFLNKLTAITLPRLRDFRGIPVRGFDKSGNYTLGIIEHTVFPEIDLSKVDKRSLASEGKPRGMQITIVMNTGDPKVSVRLLTLLGMPFEKVEGEKGNK